MALSDNIVAFYNMSDTSDATGNGNTLTNTGTVSFASSGIIGNAAGTFSTGSQRLGVSNAMSFTSGGAYTWAWWVKYTSIGGYNFDIITSSAAGRRVLCYGDSTNGRNVLFINSTDAVVTTWASSITTGTWYHIAVTWNAGAVEMFLNGVSKGTGTATGSASLLNQFSIGNASDSFGAPVNGLIDAFGMWTRVLSTAEIQSLYNSGAGLEWPFTSGAKTLAALGVG